MDLNISPIPNDDPDSKKPPAPKNSNLSCKQETEIQSESLGTSSSYGHLSSSINDPATELTEDDIFRMKSMSLTQGKLFADGSNAIELQSAISNVDSSSNYEDDQQLDIDLAHLNDSLVGEKIESYALGAENIHHQAVVHNGYVFGRIRDEMPDFNKDTVSVLTYPFEPIEIPPGENPEFYRNAYKNAKVFIVGTAHYSQDSQKDVIQAIQQTQPDLVMVELCSSRISILMMDEESLLREASSLNREKIVAIIKQSGLIPGILHILLLSTSAHITRQLGMAPGGEFRTAHKESKSILNCGLVLGDRPLQVTLKRALTSLTFWQKMRFFYHVFLTNNTSITREDVERCKNKDLLEELLKEMAGEFPQLSKILVDERDLYMTNVLHTIIQRNTAEKIIACRETKAKYEPVNVVAVVGIGHVAGITSNWNSRINCTELMMIPEPSRTSRIVKLLFKFALISCTGYLSYRCGRFLVSKLYPIFPTFLKRIQTF